MNNLDNQWDEDIDGELREPKPRPYEIKNDDFYIETFLIGFTLGALAMSIFVCFRL